jgi:hypothetical protein
MADVFAGHGGGDVELIGGTGKTAALNHLAENF